MFSLGYSVKMKLNFIQYPYLIQYPAWGIMNTHFWIFFILLIIICAFSACAFSALALLVEQQEGHPACKKTGWWGAGVVICLERGADLHMAQLMPLPLAVSCFSKIHIGFTFLVPAYPGSPGKRAVPHCTGVCACVCYHCHFVTIWWCSFDIYFFWFAYFVCYIIILHLYFILMCRVFCLYFFQSLECWLLNIVSGISLLDINEWLKFRHLYINYIIDLT